MSNEKVAAATKGVANRGESRAPELEGGIKLASIIPRRSQAGERAVIFREVFAL